MKLPKVLVGCPVSDYHEYSTDEFIEGIKNLSYSNYDILLVDNSEKDDFYNKIKDRIPTVSEPYSKNVYDRVIRSRNVLRQKALDGGYDYFLSVEQDVIPPKDAIQRMLKHGKDILSGIYFLPTPRQGKIKLVAAAWAIHPTEEGKKLDIREDLIAGNHLLKIGLCGLGCVMISRSVLEKVKFRYDLSKGDGIDDVFFCRDAREQGFELYADTAIKCRHIVKGRTWYWKELISEERLK